MSTAGGLKIDCRTFAPNIFNKNKCTNCFRQKEEHSAQALECNRTSRQVTKCGYMFVAPGWDFSDPLKRTKRWQRRWFVLYDDGELNYSVDEHPETVPQAVIDMNQVLEVTGAEDVTGHPYSLALTAPDRVHFVKASCREEARWWTDVLTVFARSKGRHKRNATFPGGQSTTIIQQQTTCRSETPNPIRPRYNSCDTEPVIPRRNVVAGDTKPAHQWNRHTAPPETQTSQQKTAAKPYEDQPASSASPPTRDRISPDEKARYRHQHRDKKRPIPSTPTISFDEPTIKSNIDSFNDSWSMNDSSKYKGLKRHEEITSVLPPSRDHSSDIVLRNVSEKPQRDTKCLSDSFVTKPPTAKNDMNDCKQQILLSLHQDHYSPTKDISHALPAEKLINLNKGWLCKLSPDHQWNRYWFVLKGAKLLYYRDPTSEELGAVDGVIQMNCIKSISEVAVIRNFGFQLTLWNDDKVVLSAVTTVIRGNWISALRRAATLLESVDLSPVLSEKDSIVPSLSVTPRSMLFSSDDEYRTASEGRSNCETADWCEQLPHSPLLTRTPVSRVKERARSRSSSGSRICKRSRSSPPSSRRSTIDSVKTDDYLDFTDDVDSDISHKTKEYDCAKDLLGLLEKTERKLRESVETEKIEPSNSNGRIVCDVDVDGRFFKRTRCETIKEKSKSVDSLSELIGANVNLQGLDKEKVIEEYADLQGRFERAIREIRVMKHKLRESHSSCDELELVNLTLLQNIKLQKDDCRSQIDTMAARVEDLTVKLSDTERRLRISKQKFQEGRGKRRSLSLKGSRESFSIGKEIEDKLTELEAKILAYQSGKVDTLKVEVKDTSSRTSKVQTKDDKKLKLAQARLRRKSLDSVTSSEPMKVLIRLSSLESKVNDVADSSVPLEIVSKPDMKLDVGNVITLAKEKVDECLRAVSAYGSRPAARFTGRRSGVDFRSIENLLNELNDILSSKSADEPIEDAFRRIEQVLKTKLIKTLDDTDVEKSTLDKLAYEMIMIRHVREAFESTDNDRIVFASQIYQISRLIFDLKRKLNKKDPAISNTIRSITESSIDPDIDIIDASLRYLSRVRDEIVNASKQSESSELYRLAEILAADTDEKSVRSEISETVDFCMEVYESGMNLNFDYFSDSRSFDNSKIQHVLRRNVRNEIDEYTESLIKAYGNVPKIEREKSGDKNIREALVEFFDIVTHKALINSYFAILNQRLQPVSMYESTDDKNLQVVSSKDKVYIKDVVDTLALIERELNKIEEYIGENVDPQIFPEKDIDCDETTTDWNSICGKCSRLHRKIVELTSCVLKRRNCKRCEQLQSTITRLNTEHEDKVQKLQRKDSPVVPKNNPEPRSESWMCLRDSKYPQHVDQSINLSVINRALQEEDSIRQKYQAEIEQLRALCEKGLVAMESSHRRVISELEERHRREREQLRLEKEAALAEETQATLAALDAMRKAHEAEVQREIAKFKKEFVRRMQLTSSSSLVPYSGEFGSGGEHEEEMEEIKQEILSLSEKYSVKCVESAALEEELIRIGTKLSQAQQHIIQLDARNKQLQAHLMSEFAESNNKMSQWFQEQDINQQHGLKTVSQALDPKPHEDRSVYRGGIKPIEYPQRNRQLSPLQGIPPRICLVDQCNACNILSTELMRYPLQQCRPIAESPVYQRHVASPYPFAGIVAERRKLFEMH